MRKVTGTTWPLAVLIIGLEKIITILTLFTCFYHYIPILQCQEKYEKWGVIVSSAFRVKEF